MLAAAAAFSMVDLSADGAVQVPTTGNNSQMQIDCLALAGHMLTATTFNSFFVAQRLCV